MYLARASRSIQGRRHRRRGQYTAVFACFCKRATADTKSVQEHELRSGRVKERGLVFVDGLLGDDDDEDVVVASAGDCCGDGSKIAWMMVLISNSVIDRSLMPYNNRPTSDEDDDDDDGEPTDGTPNSLNSCRHKGYVSHGLWRATPPASTSKSSSTTMSRSRSACMSAQ